MGMRQPSSVFFAGSARLHGEVGNSGSLRLASAARTTSTHSRWALMTRSSGGRDGEVIEKDGARRGMVCDCSRVTRRCSEPASPTLLTYAPSRSIHIQLSVPRFGSRITTFTAGTGAPSLSTSSGPSTSISEDAGAPALHVELAYRELLALLERALARAAAQEGLDVRAHGLVQRDRRPSSPGRRRRDGLVAGAGPGDPVRRRAPRLDRLDLEGTRACRRRRARGRSACAW